MKKNNKSLLLVLFTFLFFPQIVNAEYPRYYLGINFGGSELDDSDYLNDSLYLDSDNYINSKLSDSSSSSYQLFGGVKVNKFIGFELAYNQLGDYTYVIDGEISGTPFRIDGKTEPTAFTFSANLGYEFDMGLRPYLKGGLAFYKANLSGDVDIYEDDSETLPVIGLGVEYTPSSFNQITIRYELQRFSYTVKAGSEEYDHKITTNQVGIAVNF